MRATVFKRLALSLGAALLALLLVGAASLSRPWHALEFKTFDLWTSLAAPHRSRLPVVVLAIDEPTFQEVQQRWPFPRSLHARLLDRLREDGATAVGFDVVFADPSAPEQDAAFALSLAAATAAGLPVVLASAREKIDSASATLWTDVLPLPAFVAAGAQYGNAGVQPDDDFVVRRMPQLAGSFSAALARAATQHTASASAELIAYRGPRGTFDTRSYYQALEAGLLPPGFFRGKVVLIGRSALTASELQNSQADLFNSPFAALGGERLLPGVELQATLLDNRASGDGLRLAPEAWSLALVLLALTLLLPASLRWHPGAVALLAAGIVGAMALLSWLLFFKSGRWLPPLLPMAATAAIYGASALTGYAQARQRARKTRAMFSQYVPSEVVSRLIAEPALLRLGGEAREVTLLFTDLAGFTTLSEQLSAEQTVELLGLYFGTMAPIVHASGGTIDKYMGDALMAFWGAPVDTPEHAHLAVKSAMEMAGAVREINLDHRARGLPDIGIGIGLNTGTMCVGDMGSNIRRAYTVIGDAVNLGSRLEGLSKIYGVDIVVSETTRKLAQDFAWQELDRVRVKGKEQAVAIFWPMAPVTQMNEATTMELKTWVSFVKAYRAQNWDQADVLLLNLSRMNAKKFLYQTYAERVASMRLLPFDAEWDGATNFETK